MRRSYLVTGGGGYFGHRLGVSLCCDGVDVRLFDCRFNCTEKEPANITDGELTSITGDVSSFSDVLLACKDVDCVMHLASYGMSGRDMLNTSRIEEVNVQGTKNIIEGIQLL
jgi:nucleoside-diphosphate-sugar epimerase